MASTLRDEVEALAISLHRQSLTSTCGLQGIGLASAEGQLRIILDRHPAADGVLVPRGLLESLRDYSAEHSSDLGQSSTVRRKQQEIASCIAQASAILSATEAGP